MATLYPIPQVPPQQAPYTAPPGRSAPANGQVIPAPANPQPIDADLPPVNIDDASPGEE